MKQNVFSFFILCYSCFLAISCGENSSVEGQVQDMQIPLELHRFDLKFKETTPEKLHSIKQEYPFFFPEQTPDSIWLAKITDPIQQQLLEEVSKAFPESDSLGTDISHLYAHFAYHFKQQKPPKIYTLTNEVAHDFRVIATDSMWLVALDNYLGPGHDFYKTFPSYIKREKDLRFLMIDLAAAVSELVIPKPKQPYFLSKMVYEGKKIFVQQMLWPHDNTPRQFHFTEEEYRWATENEAQIWRYFIENKLLYSTEKDLAYRFLYPAPFSKFNLEIDQDSPGQIGVFMGFQLVKSYYKNKGEDLQKLLQISAVDLLKEAAYKPKK